MKVTWVAIAGTVCLIAFLEHAQAYTGQQYIFTRGSLNTNMCTRPNGCETPKTLSMTAPAPVINQTVVAPPAVQESGGIVSRALSGIASIF